jgi:hypothetical protein
MTRKAIELRCLSLILLAPAIGLLATPVHAGSPSLADSMPPGALAYAEVSELEPVIDRFRASDVLKLLLTSQPYQDVEKTPQHRKAQAVRQILETHLGMDLWTLGKKLLGGRVALGVYPKQEGQPDVVLIVRAADPQVLALLRERIEPVLVLADDQIEASESSEGVQVIQVGKQAAFALHETWFVAANNGDLLAKTLDLLTGNGKGSLADDAGFQAMARQMGTEHLGRVFVNTGLLAKATGGRFGVPKKQDNPLGSLLLGGIIELIVNSPFAGLTLNVQDEQFVLTAEVAGKPSELGETYEPFFASFPKSGTRPLPQPPDLIAGFTLYRDFGGWYRRREELLQPQLLPGFDQFESGIGNLLPGKDFSEDVLPLIGNNITVVAAPQDYSHLDGEPGVKIPGFAAIIELAKPEEGAEMFRLFFQTFSAILNIEAGQQGRQPWVLESESYKYVMVTYGKYLKKPSGDRLPLVFNFRPASARVGDQFIISSSLSVCQQVIDELQKPENNKPVDKNLNLEFRFGPFADILEANQDFFQAQRIQQGRTPQQAVQDVSTVLDLFRNFNSLGLSTAATHDGFQIQLKGSWK